MQVEGYVKCIQANFGGHGLTIFRDIATLMFGQISLLDHGLIMGGQKMELAQKIHAIRGVCEMYASQF